MKHTELITSTAYRSAKLCESSKQPKHVPVFAGMQAMTCRQRERRANVLARRVLWQAVRAYYCVACRGLRSPAMPSLHGVHSRLVVLLPALL